MRILLRLYPATWRARYEEEFLAVLEERPLSPFDWHRGRVPGVETGERHRRLNATS